MRTYDAVVAGGGAAGAAAALALARRGGSVLLVEASEQAEWKIGETLAPEARPVLVSLGVWEDFTKAGHLPAPGAVSAWGSDDLTERDFIFNPYGHAWQLDRRGFESFLLARAEMAGVETVRGQRVARWTREGTGWRLGVGNQSVESRWVIDATGRSSALARQLGVKRMAVDRLVSIHARVSVRPKVEVDARTFLESRRDGWWYSVPVPDGARVIAYQTDAPLLIPRRRLDLNWLIERASETRHLQALLTKWGCDFSTEPRLTSAQSSKLERMAGPGWMAVGDAAACFDPLSGQGLFKALLSGVKAAEAVASGRKDAANEYAGWHEGLWNRYLRDRGYFYAAEQRWSASPFWCARHAVVRAALHP